MCLSTGGKWLGVPRVPVCRPCEYKQTACWRSCRGHSKAGPQVAEQQHVETVARQGVTPRALPKGCCKMSLPIPKQQDTYVALRATTRRLGNKSSASGQRRETQQSSISKTQAGTIATTTRAELPKTTHTTPPRRHRFRCISLLLELVVCACSLRRRWFFHSKTGYTSHKNTRDSLLFQVYPSGAPFSHSRRAYSSTRLARPARSASRATCSGVRPPNASLRACIACGSACTRRRATASCPASAAACSALLPTPAGCAHGAAPAASSNLAPSVCPCLAASQSASSTAARGQ